MVKDINQGVAGSYPAGLTNINGILFFRGSDGFYGDELWKSDGTSVGTVMVKNINPVYNTGGIGTYPFFTNVNGILFFVANDGVSERELWRSDGTDAGTVMVKDINPGSVSSVPWGLINANGTLYFQANDGNNGTELWKSDGTAGGTIMVKDIKPGTNGSEPASLTNVNGTVYFQAQDGISGIELWKSDGTLAGTVMVKDINPGPSYSEPNNFTNVNGTLYFYALSPTAGQELWKSDGTSAGTLMVIDIATGTNSSSPDNLTNVNGTLFFVALNGSGRELWALSIPTSIGQNYSDDSDIFIYPNPTNGKSKINVNSSSISKIEIYNLQGGKVFTMEKNHQQTLDEIDISDLSKGIYLVKISDGGKYYSKKLIVQ